MGLSTVVALVAAILTAAVVVPQSGARTAAAAPAALTATFRDLPVAVRTGESLRVMLDVPGGSVCDGVIVYRDNASQILAPVNADDDRCRWDVIVPDGTRRGEADVTVVVKSGNEKATFRAFFNVGVRAEDVALVLKDLPGTVKRNSQFTIRIDVPDKATCQGTISYEGSRVQALDSRTEDNEECRWSVTVPADAPRGEARVSVTVTNDGRQSNLLSSFDVSHGTDDPELLIAFQDFPTTVARDGAFAVRVMVPTGASCKGEARFRSADNVSLDLAHEYNGLCRWSVTVPKGAKRGDAEVDVTVSNDGKDTGLSGKFRVEEIAEVVDAKFKELPLSIRRGEDLEVRVNVPEGASCRGDVTFDDGETHALDTQTEKKDRCLWSVRVPAYTSRGVAVVRVWVDDHGVPTSLIGNVRVDGREDDALTATWESLPKDVERSQKFEVAVQVAAGSTCAGTITFPNDFAWTLGQTAEHESYCRWTVQVPRQAKPGQAKIEVAVKKRDKTTLQSTFMVKGTPDQQPAPTTAAPATASAPPAPAPSPAPVAPPVSPPTQASVAPAAAP